MALFEYGGQVAHAVRSLKYRGRLHVARTLGRLMTSHLAGLAPDRVIPVPLHPRRLRARGFNHAAELARWAARGQPFRFLPAVLVRCKDGPPQAGATVAQRKTLGPSAFAVTRPPSVRGRSVVLVDDVFTTGATAAACAKVLLTAGAESVDVLAVCRSVM